MADKKNSVGAAWKRQTKTGKDFFSVTIGDQRFTMWCNDYKKADKEPDYRLYVDDYEKPQTGRDNQFENAARGRDSNGINNDEIIGKVASTPSQKTLIETIPTDTGDDLPF